MTNLNSLPAEILGHMMSYLGRDIKDLHKYTLSCRAISGAAQAELYKNIDLTFDKRDGEVNNNESVQRQAQLIRSLAEYYVSYRALENN
jgi:hypothetical protein